MKQYEEKLRRKFKIEDILDIFFNKDKYFSNFNVCVYSEVLDLVDTCINSYQRIDKRGSSWLKQNTSDWFFMKILKRMDRSVLPFLSFKICLYSFVVEFFSTRLRFSNANILININPIHKKFVLRSFSDLNKQIYIQFDLNPSS